MEVLKVNENKEDLIEINLAGWILINKNSDKTAITIPRNKSASVKQPINFGDLINMPDRKRDSVLAVVSSFGFKKWQITLVKWILSIGKIK